MKTGKFINQSEKMKDRERKNSSCNRMSKAQSTAGKTALQSGQKTFQDVCAEQDKDWKEAVNEMAEVLEYGRSVGVELGGVIFGNGTTAAQQNTAGK